MGLSVSSLKVYGRTGSPQAYAIRDYLYRSDVPFEWIEHDRHAPRARTGHALRRGGNIRQLQNIIEHNAILCDDPMLRIRPELLVERTPGPGHASRLETALTNSEQQLIEQALQQAEGRVSGPSGAAARLGVPASTLESKLKRSRIDKFRYRSAHD